MPTATLTAIVHREGDLYVAPCPELDIASQGASVEEAAANLKEAVEAFLEAANPHEIAQRTSRDVRVVTLEVVVP